jgi:hypothetical protein
MKLTLVSMLVIFTASGIEAKKNKYIDVSISQLTTDIKKANRIVVREEPMRDSKILFKSNSRKDIEDLIESININENHEKFHCMCLGSPAIYLYNGNKLINIISNHHGISIRTNNWNSDAKISDIEKWLHWFDSRNITSPREEFETAKKENEKYREYYKRWISVMPKSILPVWDKAQGNFGGLNDSTLIAALARDTANEQTKIRQLLKWYGSGAGPWSGFPSYEEAGSILLNEFSISQIINNGNIDSLDLTEKHGLARLLCGWDFNRKHVNSQDSIPKNVKFELMNTIKVLNDSDKTNRANRYFNISK